MKLPENVSESVKQRNPELYRKELVGAEAVVILPVLSKLPTSAPNTDVVKLNKTERAYYDWLLTNDYPWVGVQCFTLKLGDDTRYTPDFWVLDRNGLLIAKEVKGFWRDDAKVKIKVAARMYPFFQFQVITKAIHRDHSNHQWPWHHQPVKP